MAIISATSIHLLHLKISNKMFESQYKCVYWKASEVRSENKCDETCEKNVKNYTTMKN